MNTHHTQKPAADATSRRDPSREALDRKGLRQSAADPRAELDDAPVEDLGGSVEDEIRGRRGSGIAPADDVRSDGDDDERNERR